MVFEIWMVNVNGEVEILSILIDIKSLEMPSIKGKKAPCFIGLYTLHLWRIEFYEISIHPKEKRKKEKAWNLSSMTMRLFSFHICQYVCCFSSFCYHYHYYHHHHHQRFIILVRVGRLLLVCTIELQHKRSITAPSILDKIIKKKEYILYGY